MTAEKTDRLGDAICELVRVMAERGCPEGFCFAIIHGHRKKVYEVRWLHTITSRDGGYGQGWRIESMDTPCAPYTVEFEAFGPKPQGLRQTT